MFSVHRYFQRKVLREIATAIPDNSGVKCFVRKKHYRLIWDDICSCHYISDFDKPSFMKCLSGDYSRFALSGLESYERALQTVGDPNTAWPAIQLYYADYYFANSLMRACGISVSRLEKVEIIALNELHSLFSLQSESLSKGEYILTWSPSVEPSGKLRLDVAPGAGGAHEKFWIIFSDFLDEFVSEIDQQALPDSLEAISSLTDLLKVLGARGMNGKNWLSMVRNEITYKHMYDVWSPTSRRNRSVPPLKSIARKNLSAIRLDHNPNTDPVDAFVAGCQYLIELGLLVAEAQSEVSAQNGAFGSRWNRCLAIQRP
jgi:hypothetical protein